ncbi:MAG: Rieske 2Fe-2S domain-containing protein, partial [Polymorphobacter sp.]
IIAKLHDAFHAGVEAFAGPAARAAVERDGLRSLHRHFPIESVLLLEDFINKRIRDDLYHWAYQVGHDTIGLPDPFYVDMLIVIRVHYPQLVARRGGKAAPPPFDWRERARLVAAGVRKPSIFVNQVTRRLRKRAKIAAHQIAFNADQYHGDLPTLARSHGPHIDTWYGHSYDGFNVWLSIDGVNTGNTVILYPELFGNRVDYDPASMYLAPGINLPAPTKIALEPGQLLLFNPEMLHGTQVNISEDTRVALTMRINPGVPRFNDNAPFNAEHWYASPDLAQRNFSSIALFPANTYHGEPSVGQVPVPADPHTRHLVLTTAPAATGETVLGASSLLPDGDKLAIDAPGLRLLLVRSVDGLRAYDRRCPHRLVDIADGHHDTEQIFCPGHGIAFNLSDGKSKCDAFKLRRYAVTERDGQLILLRGDAAADPAGTAAVDPAGTASAAG